MGSVNRYPMFQYLWANQINTPGFGADTGSKILSPNKASVWSKKPKRDFIYLEDAADAIMLLLNTSYTGPVNLGTGVSASIGKIADILKKCSGKETEDLNMEVSGPMNFCCDVSLLSRLTDGDPNTLLSKGSKELITE